MISVLCGCSKSSWKKSEQLPGFVCLNKRWVKYSSWKINIYIFSVISPRRVTILFILSSLEMIPILSPKLHPSGFYFYFLVLCLLWSFFVLTIYWAPITCQVLSGVGGRELIKQRVCRLLEKAAQKEECIPVVLERGHNRSLFGAQLGYEERSNPTIKCFFMADLGVPSYAHLFCPQTYQVLVWSWGFNGDWNQLLLGY